MPFINEKIKRPIEVIERYGRCLELIPVDKHFKDISVGLYVKDPVCTIWTYSQVEGVSKRLRAIRDQMIKLGDMEAIPNTPNQVQFTCGNTHSRPLKFLLSQEVVKSPSYRHAEGPMTISDTKSPLTINVQPYDDDDSQSLYQVSVSGTAKNPQMRLRMILAGFARYGEMEKAEDNDIFFTCRHRHDNLLKLLMPYSRNISSVEGMIAAESLRGQMTTGTLGFSQT
mgnify:CR=1 FL=1